MVTTDLETWSRSFSEFTASFAHRIPRVESRRQATSYLRGLLSELERKNGWTLSEMCGEQGPERLQRLLNFYAWDTDGVRDDVRDLVVEALADTDHGVLLLDDTGFLKKGTKSGGVTRQYSGTVGRIENCQIGVFLAYASSMGRALIDRELYLPKAWTEDHDWCREAGIGDEVAFATKRAARLGRAVAGMGRVYEHVTPEMERRVRSVLEARWARSVGALTARELDRLFGMAPILEEHYRGNSESGLPKEPASKLISQIFPKAG